MAANTGFGQMQPDDQTSEYNVMAFIVRQILGQIATAKIVTVVAIHPGSGSPPAIGTVDVQPLVSQVDGQGNVSPHGTIFGIPVLRLAGGAWQITNDPAVGDVGLMVVCDRDSSAVVSKIESGTTGASVQPVAPGSNRRFDLADGIYIGALISAQADSGTIWLKTDGTLQIADSKGNVLSTSSSGFSLTGNVAVTGNLTATGSIKAGFGGGDQVGLQTHDHSGVTTGAGTSGPPVAGT